MYDKHIDQRSPELSSIEIEMSPCLSDNVGFLLYDPETGRTAAIDTPEVAPITAALERRAWRPSYILNTHHHGDHAGGNLELKRLTGCRIIGPRHAAKRIPGIDAGVADGEIIGFGAHLREALGMQGDDVAGYARTRPSRRCFSLA